jgi:hypothetical protein
MKPKQKKQSKKIREMYRSSRHLFIFIEVAAVHPKLRAATNERLAESDKKKKRIYAR